MNLAKSYEFFNPDKVHDTIHIIGCGSVGSTVAELLARYGLVKFVLYDFDIVKPHNLVNQMFTEKHLNMKKTEAVKQMIHEINPLAEIVLYDGWDHHPLDGYVFLAVDNIELRAEIVKSNMYNTMIKAMFDFRTGLTDGQHFAADWSVLKNRKTLLGTMDFTHEQAKKNSPISACNVALCVASTVRLICTVGVSNFINFVNYNKLKRIIVTDAFDFTLEAVE